MSILSSRIMLATALAAGLAAPAFADGFAEFRACALEGDANVTATFHHCTAPLVSHCGASATAKEAAACIDAARSDIETEITRASAALGETTGDGADAIADAMSGNRSAGEASCALMAQQDATTGVKVGQRAVNASFCQAIASGDVLGMVYRMEAPE